MKDSFMSKWIETANEIRARGEDDEGQIKLLTAYRMKIKYGLKESASDIMRRKDRLRARKVEAQKERAPEGGLMAKLADMFGFDPTEEREPPKDSEEKEEPEKPKRVRTNKLYAHPRRFGKRDQR